MKSRTCVLGQAPLAIPAEVHPVLQVGVDLLLQDPQGLARGNRGMKKGLVVWQIRPRDARDQK